MVVAQILAACPGVAEPGKTCIPSEGRQLLLRLAVAERTPTHCGPAVQGEGNVSHKALDMALRLLMQEAQVTEESHPVVVHT